MNADVHTTDTDVNEANTGDEIKQSNFYQSSSLSHASSTTISLLYGSKGWKKSLSYSSPYEHGHEDQLIVYGTLIALGPSEYFKSYSVDASNVEQHKIMMEYKAIGPNNKKYILKQKAETCSSSFDGVDIFQIGSKINEYNDITIKGQLSINDDMETTTSVKRVACQIVCQREHPYRCFVCIRASLLDQSKQPTKIRVYRPLSSCWTDLSLTNIQIELIHNSIVDVNGALLLFKSDGRAQPIKKLDAKAVINQFNSMKASCPVMMSTLAFEYVSDSERNKRESLSWKKAVGKHLHEVDADINVDDYGDIETNGNGAMMKTSKASCIEPWVFVACGHVHGYSESLEGSNCPLCRRAGPFIPIKMAFVNEICNDQPTHIFNPCGHAASLECVQFYANIPSSISNYSYVGGDAELESKSKLAVTPCCPFCGVQLATDTPYNKLIFQLLSDSTDSLPDAKRLKSPSNSPSKAKQ